MRELKEVNVEVAGRSYKENEFMILRGFVVITTKSSTYVISGMCNNGSGTYTGNIWYRKKDEWIKEPKNFSYPIEIGNSQINLSEYLDLEEYSETQF